jgi:hypothetical protein
MEAFCFPKISRNFCFPSTTIEMQAQIYGSIYAQYFSEVYRYVYYWISAAEMTTRTTTTRMTPGVVGRAGPEEETMIERWFYCL